MELVFDSSPLILLAKIEIIRPASDNFQIIIPERVKVESTYKSSFDAKLILSLLEDNTIKVVKLRKRKMVNKLCKDFNIHSGEAEALSLALERDKPLAVDDLPTIKACKILNHSFTTAIHLLIKMAENKKLDSEMSLLKLDKLAYYGRYKKQIIIDAARRLKGGF